MTKSKFTPGEIEKQFDKVSQLEFLFVCEKENLREFDLSPTINGCRSWYVKDLANARDLYVKSLQDLRLMIDSL